MADQLFVTYRVHGFAAQNMVRHYETLLRLFPYSRLSKGVSVLRVTAVSPAEPALYEQAFEDPVQLDLILPAIREYAAPDSGLYLDTRWDLWQFETDWSLQPARVTLAAFGPGYDIGAEENLRIDFGLDTHFLPQPEIPNNLFMARSNVRSLLHLVHEIDRAFPASSRQLWTESGENFAEKLTHALTGSDLPS